MRSRLLRPGGRFGLRPPARQLRRGWRWEGRDLGRRMVVGDHDPAAAREEAIGWALIGAGGALAPEAVALRAPWSACRGAASSGRRLLPPATTRPSHVAAQARELLAWVRLQPARATAPASRSREP